MQTVREAPAQLRATAKEWLGVFSHRPHRTQGSLDAVILEGLAVAVFTLLIAAALLWSLR